MSTSTSNRNDQHEKMVRELMGEEYFDPEAPSLDERNSRVVKFEALEADTWEACSIGFDAALDNAIFNVEHTERWKAAPQYQGVAATATAQPRKGGSDRTQILDVVKHLRHVSKCHKARARWGLEELLDGRELRQERIVRGVKQYGHATQQTRRMARLAAKAARADRKAR